MDHPDPRPERTTELGANLADLEHRVQVACDSAGRPRSEVHVIVVTKTFPASDVVRLVGLGVRDVAENRDQEARDKARQVTAEVGDRAPRWHFVGQLQRNKVRSVARYADVVHSVDRLSLVEALSRAAHDTVVRASERPLGVLVQVALDDADGRGGAFADEVPRVARAVADVPGLTLLGVMAVAPLGQDPHEAFARLMGISRQVSSEHPGATWVSAGMSGDLEAAIGAGATHLRVGSAVLGSRQSLG